MVVAVGEGGADISTDFINYSKSPNVSIFSFMVVFCLLGMAYAGINRFTIIAFTVAFANIIGVTAEFYTWTAEYDGRARSNLANVFFTYLGYCLGDTVVVLYGYFFVEKLLPTHTSKGDWLISRRLFMWIFWALQIGHIVSRIAGIISVMVDFAKTRNAAPPVIYDYTLARFIILTTIELFTAYFLIVIFRRSRKIDVRYLGGKRLPLLKHLLLSTEFRVASMSILYLFRASVEKAKQRGDRTAKLIDGAVLPFLGLFPMLLILDCVLRKALSIEVEYQARNDRCTCLKQDNESGSAMCAAERVVSDASTSEKKGGILPRVEEEAGSSHSS